jgi:DNA-binding LacI/PurR family transcriptional regulator
MALTPRKPVRLIDIARRANLSRVVVGKVLLGSGSTTRVSDATARRVRRIAREMDYRPSLLARHLGGQRTRTLGAIVGANRYPIYYERLRAIDREANARGFRMMVSYIHDEQSPDEFLEQLNDMEGRGAEAIILMHNLVTPGAPLKRRLRQSRLVVCHTPAVAMPNMSIVTVDLAGGAQMLFDHLVQAGRRRIGLLAQATVRQASSKRAEGFRAAAQRHAPSVAAFQWFSQTVQDAMTPQSIRPIVEEGLDALLAQHVDAIMATNDQWAVQVIKALLRRGRRVPDDIAVTGVDNIEASTAVIPELTTLDLENAQFAREVLDVCDRIEEENWPPADGRRISVTPRLVVRESTLATVSPTPSGRSGCRTAPQPHSPRRPEACGKETGC